MAAVGEVLPAAVGDEGAGVQRDLPDELTIALDREHEGLALRSDRDAGRQDEGRVRAPDSALAGAGANGAQGTRAERALAAGAERLGTGRRGRRGAEDQQ